MSVAFRRDSDEEHLEPKFELPIPPGPNWVTSRGLAQTQAKVAEIEALLPALTADDAITAARRQLRYWRTRLAMAQPIQAPDGSCVAIGCQVTLLMHGKRRTITIVGDDEADPANGLLAFSAPLCQAIMDAEVGDRLAFADRDDAIEIVSIELPAS